MINALVNPAPGPDAAPWQTGEYPLDSLTDASIVLSRVHSAFTSDIACWFNGAAHRVRGDYVWVGATVGSDVPDSTFDFASAQVFFYDVAGNELVGDVVQGVARDPSGEQRAVATGPVPDGAASAIAVFGVYSDAAASATGAAWLSEAMAVYADEPFTEAPDYFDGDTRFHRWLGTPHASESTTALLAAAIASDVAPLLVDDDQNDYAGTTLVTAIAAPGEAAHAISLEPDSWWDPRKALDEQIPGMASRASIPNVKAQTIANLRYRLENKPGYEVGSTEAIKEAVRALLAPGAFVKVKSGYQPGVGYVWGHTTVIVKPSEAGAITEDQIKAAAEQGAADWQVIHAHIGTTWSEEAAAHATWTDLATDHSDWSDAAGGH